MEAIKTLYLSKKGKNTCDLKMSSYCKEEENIQIAALVSGEELLFVSRRGEEVLGVATFVESSCRLKDVVVRPSVRGNKVGSTLISSIKAYAMEKLSQDCNQQLITVVVKSISSRIFFEKQGFKISCENETAENVKDDHTQLMHFYVDQ